MKIKSALITQMSGSVGGLTGSHNQGGLYFRARAIPTNPASAQQQAVRNALAQLTARWSDTLTAAQRDAWAAYNDAVTILDRLGEPRKIGALAHYVRANTPRIQAAATIVDDGPTTFSLPDLVGGGIAGIDATTDTLSVSFDDAADWCDEDDAHLLVYASRPKAATINFFKGPYRLAGSIDGDSSTAPSSPADLDLPFSAADGNKVFVQLRLSRADGRLSSPLRYSALAVAI